MKTISVDPTGAAAIAKAIPKDGWNKMVNVACNTFSDVMSPLTKTTAGLGGLIEGKFKAMIDVQKVFAADALARARKKFDSTGRVSAAPPKAKVLLPAIESASVETDDGLRDIWANLIANEMLDASVHPEFPSILARLGPHDAKVLSEIARNNTKSWVKAAAQKLASSISILGVNFDEPVDFSREHLNRLGLIKRPDGIWTLTHFGEEFVKAVTEPKNPRETERSDHTPHTQRRHFDSADHRAASTRRR
ncbi:MAG TPA: Abi-alpha family protein [Verrucomicrobiae bacterium]|nr:Abi-alpha family protein [Verrucomicrobiae bacterium]